MGVTRGEERHHSYQTLLASTHLQTFTVIVSPALTVTGAERGIKRGNQLNIPLE
jgi:hypothetical protein